MLGVLSDEYFMEQAIKEAQKALEMGEVPVGAVIVADQMIIAKGHNTTQQLKDVTAHAEILAISSAAQFLHSKYLPDCTLYVTLEPCVMCAGALNWAQIGRVVYGASDDKRGFMRYGKTLLHPKTQVESGVLEPICIGLMQDFFRARR